MSRPTIPHIVVEELAVGRLLRAGGDFLHLVQAHLGPLALSCALWESLSVAKRVACQKAEFTIVWAELHQLLEAGQEVREISVVERVGLVIARDQRLPCIVQDQVVARQAKPIGIHVQSPEELVIDLMSRGHLSAYEAATFRQNLAAGNPTEVPSQAVVRKRL